MTVFKIILAVSFGILMASCDPGSDQFESDSKTDARTEKLVGNWRCSAKLAGGQALAEVSVDLESGKTFVMNADVGERAHVLNAYPTVDRIRMTGNWSMDGDSEILLDGKIEEFHRTQITGGAARHGFLADSHRGTSESYLVPLPFDHQTSLRVGQDGRIHLDLIEFRGRKADASDDDARSRMVTNVVLEKAAN